LPFETTTAVVIVVLWCLLALGAAVVVFDALWRE
jgi:hypothetical protein